VVGREITLHKHQAAQVSEVRAALREHKSVLMQSPTGSGKTVMASSMIASSQAKGKTSLFVVPRLELVTQVSETLDWFGVPHSYIVSGKVYNPYAKTHICTMQTLARRLDCIKHDVLFTDEAHYGTGQLDKIIQRHKAQGGYTIGMSATPLRRDGRGLGCWFETMVQGASVGYLIKNGFLSDYKAYAATKPKGLDGLRIRGGEYAQEELSELMEADKVLIGDSVTHWRRYAAGRLTVVFAVTRKHAQIVQAQFEAAGIPTGYIDGTMKQGERRAVIMDFANRVTPVLVSVNLLQFGFDLATAAGMDVRVEALVDLQPVKSLAMQMQKWGRCLRAGEPSVILDHARNIAEHGLPDDDREWTLADRKKRDGGKRDEELAQTVACGSCKSKFRRELTHCPYCGAEKPKMDELPEQVDGELQELDKDAVRLAKKREQGAAQSIQDLIKLGESRGYKNAAFWAAKVWTSRMAKR